MDATEDLNVLTASYDTDDDLAAAATFPYYPDELLQFARALCVIFVIIGIPANFITIVALAICRKFRNATAIFIINLHISNLIFCCVVLPLTANIYSSRHWTLGRVMCNVYPLLKYGLNCTAHLTVVAITINRYIIICHPQIYPRLYKRKILIMTLISTWVVGILIFLPTFFGVWGKFDLDPKGGECTMRPDENNVCPRAFFLVLAFVGPSIIFVVCYSQIWWTVRKAAKRRMKHNSSAIPPISMSGSDAPPIENRVISIDISSSESSTDDDNTIKVNIPDSTPSQDHSMKKFIRRHFNLTGNKNELHLPTRKDKKLANMIVALMVTFILCYSPIMILRVIFSDYESHPIPNVLVHLMEYSSVFLSPLIYVIMSTEYVQAYVNLFDEIKSAINNVKHYLSTKLPV